jgi:hypothetical protein
LAQAAASVQSMLLYLFWVSETPRTSNFPRLLTWGLRQRAQPKRFGRMPPGAAHSLSGWMYSLIGQKEFPVLQWSAGNRLQAVEPAWRLVLKPPRGAGIVRNFQEFPAHFPVLRESGPVANCLSLPFSLYHSRRDCLSRRIRPLRPTTKLAGTCGATNPSTTHPLPCRQTKSVPRRGPT